MKLRDLSSIESALNIINDPHTRITFSQFGEDIIIWSLLQTCGMLDKKGFYVDVGALHPSYSSNTKMLNLMGWTGINIDANADSVAHFMRERPNDQNIVAAISDEPGEITFHIYDAGGLSTADPKMVDHHNRTNEYKIVRSIQLHTERLAAVLERTLPPDQKIDLMSVDVEGYDLKVLRSNDWHRFAPFFLLVEDHELSLLEKPNTEIFEFLKPLGYRLASVAFVTSIYIHDQV